jgi:hypothetical protein
MASPALQATRGVTRKARHTGDWWKSRQQRLEERASVKRHFAMWRQATSPLGAKREHTYADGSVAFHTVKLTWKEYSDHVRKHKASWLGQAAPPTVRIGIKEFPLAA